MVEMCQAAAAISVLVYASRVHNVLQSLGTGFGLTMAYVLAQTIYYVLKKALQRLPVMGVSENRGPKI